MRLLDEIDGNEIEPFTECHEYFELGLSFSSVLMFLDKEDWEMDGVLLVRTSDPEGLAKWPIGVGEETFRTGQKLDRSGLTHLSLEGAMEEVFEMYRQSETETQRARRLKPNDSLHVCVF